MMDPVASLSACNFNNSPLAILIKTDLVAPTVNRRRAAPARRNTRAAITPCSSGRAGRSVCYVRVGLQKNREGTEKKNKKGILKAPAAIA
ncbi:MAG: hypothetical protein J5U17_10335 [Candidatus Methanoperedens sp.]|nr:hypothetical protein [Candidatus Methanoperedens sp.]MCE8426159.1 hypothetical protein [Candidatus Methanoperedens sp.]MCE8428526.1 hypothetical protein [Candidatus Methanoperedens sp.]